MLMPATALVVLVRMSLWLLPSRAIVQVVRRLESAHRADSASHMVTISLIVWAVAAVARRIPRATCLTQSIAAKILLRAFGYDAQLCLGVARNADGSLRAHAWLERGGRAVLGGEGAHTLYRLPPFTDDARIFASPSFTR